MDNTASEISRLEGRAALLERQADEREESAPAYYGGGSSAFVLELETADQYRTEARELRREAAALRRRQIAG